MPEHFHAVWGTKRRFPFLKGEKKKIIIDHIHQTAIAKGIHIHALNGGYDHLHCVFDKPDNQDLEKVLMYFKGESSFWINRNNLFRIKFNWSRRYYLERISPLILHKIIHYVENQEEHHGISTPFEQKWAKDLKKIRTEASNNGNLR